MNLEYCVMMDRFPDEPHRGPWTLSKCEEWLKEALEDGFRTDAFYVAVREVGPWTKMETIESDGRWKVSENYWSYEFNEYETD